MQASRNCNIFSTLICNLKKNPIRYIYHFQIMDQNNAKIVLILLVFSIGLVQARPSLLDAIKNVKELGVGACSMERYTELTQKMQECSQQKQAELQGGLGSLTICSIIDPMLKCNFTEFFLYAIIFIHDCFDF